jgi:hypothetical protein
MTSIILARKLVLSAAALGLTLASAFDLPAQKPFDTKPVLGNPAIWFIVGNLERSAALYHDVLGFEFDRPLSPGGQTGVQPFRDSGPVGVMNNTPEAKMRSMSLRAPGSPLRIDFLQYKDVDLKPTSPWHLGDAGSASMVLLVRDLDKELGKLKGAHVSIIRDQNQVAPFTLASAARMAFVQDQDGFFFGLSQPKSLPESTAPPDSNMVGLYLQYVVADMDHTLKVFKDIFELEFKPIEKIRDKSGAEVLRAEAVIPGDKDLPFGTFDGPFGNASPRNVVFIDFKTPNRRQLHSRVQDPGTALITLQLRDERAVAQALEKEGLRLITTVNKGEPLQTGKILWLLFQDTNNILLELSQTKNQ